MPDFEQFEKKCWTLKGRKLLAKAEYRSAVRSRKLINTALVDLLQEKPLDKITVTDVVTRAGINRGTFYAHYADIPDVINHLIQTTFSKIRSVLPQDSSELARMPDTLLLEIQKILEEDMDFYKKVMASGASTLMYGQLVEIVLDYLLQREDDYAIGSHEQFVMTIRFCAGGLSNLYRDWFEGRLDMSLTELSENAQRLLTGVMKMQKPMA